MDHGLRRRRPAKETECGKILGHYRGVSSLLGIMECKVDTLMKEEISLMGRCESIFGMTNNTVYQLPSEPSRQEEFEDLVMNFILGKLKEEKIIEQNKTKKIKNITRYPDTEDLEPLNDHKFSKTLTKE
ncbi:hypothetical protein Tco_0027988, partial [Tanacetum coccineum]